MAPVISRNARKHSSRWLAETSAYLENSIALRTLFTGFDIMAVRKRGQKPNFWYRAMCFGQWAKVKRASCLTAQFAKRSSVGPTNRLAMPWFQRSGRTVNGPKNATLPHLVAKLDPTRSLPRYAPKAADGSAAHRVRT